MLYVINGSILLQKGAVNSIIYNPESKKIIHVKNALADTLIEKGTLPKKITDFIGESYEVITSEKYLERNPIKPEIDSIYIDLTDACNLRCRGCYSYEVSDNNKNITTEKLDWISTLKASSNCNLILLGGEPLLYPKKKLKQYLKKWSAEFNKVTIFTNGCYFDKEWAEFLYENNISVRFTLYSFDANYHDSYVGLVGGFDAVLKALAIAKEQLVNHKLNLILNETEFLTSDIGLQTLGLDIQHTFIDLIRPTHHHSVDEYIAIKRKKDNQPRPIKYKSFKKSLIDSQYHSCFSGKISLSVDGGIFHCPWEKNKSTTAINDFSMEQAVNCWKQPIQKAYTDCESCEFSFLCFDCTSLNFALSKGKATRPVMCQYNPLLGKIE